MSDKWDIPAWVYLYGVMIGVGLVFVIIIMCAPGCDVPPQQTELRTTPYSTYCVSTSVTHNDSIWVLPMPAAYHQVGVENEYPVDWSVFRFHVIPGDYQLWWTPHGDTLAVMINKPRVKEKGVLTFLIYKLEPGDKTRMVRL